MDNEVNVETRASEMGWVPKENFRGDPERWIDAETFVKRGEELLPILRANSRKQSEELNAMRTQLAETQSLLKASAESIDALKEFNSKALREQAKEKRGELVDAIKNARESGDVEAEVALTEQLAETREALKEAEKKPTETPKPQDQQDFTKTPEWKEWTEENDWFGKDRRRTALALGIADEMRSNGEKITGRGFLDKVSAEVDKVLGTGARQAASKVEGGARSSGGGGSSGGTSFADLPADARAACDRQADRLVGKGRAFETKEAWRKHYAAKYFEEA